MTTATSVKNHIELLKKIMSRLIRREWGASPTKKPPEEVNLQAAIIRKLSCCPVASPRGFEPLLPA